MSATEVISSLRSSKTFSSGREFAQSATTWGVQPAISNELTAGNWEYVNWEPDDTPSYILGNPLGALVFQTNTAQTNAWELY